MKLLDPRFTKFDGTQVTGRVPAVTIVEGRFDMTPDQEVGVAHAYKIFRDIRATAIGDFFVQNRTLPDGTRVRMESMQDRDTVYVWPAGDGNESLKLPHGLAVVTNWRKPRIYKRRLVWPEGETRWKFADDRVPQLTGGISDTVVDNQVFRVHDAAADPQKFFNLPMVLRKSVRTVWDWGRRQVSAGLGAGAYPFRLKNATTGEFSFRPAHYADTNKITDAAGTTLYTMADSPAILAVDPEAQIFLPSSSDSNGNQLAMQHMRQAVISPTFNIWTFRFCNERINRTADTSYAQVERNVISLNTPVAKQTTTVTSINDGALGESPDAMLKATATGAALGGSGWFDPPGVFVAFYQGWGEGPIDISGVPRRGAFVTALRQVVTQAPGSLEIQKLVAVGSQDKVDHIDLLAELNYPAEILWRGGISYTSYYRSDVFGSSFPGSGYGVTAASIDRRDTKYHVDGAPKVTAKLGWKDLLLFEGTTTGRMDGRIYNNTEVIFGKFDQKTGAFVTREVATGVPYPELYAWMTARNIRYGYFEELRLAWETTDYGGPNPLSRVTAVYNERPSNTVSYTLKSRYVIDYDHKGRFYAAIRCEVVCSGAAWAEDATVYEGYMKKVSDPTYTVKIYFECGWGGVVGTLPDGLQSELLLVEETITRPGFEIIAIEKFNPWYWPYPAYLDRSCVARVPPEPTIDENFMQQMKTLASHQGVNTNIAVQDIRTDMPEPPDLPETSSEKGIEFSWQHNGRVVPHEKFVTGQLYARTFKLSDFSEAFWLLYQLKVNAIEGNVQPVDAPDRPEWFYHPVIKAALDVKRHIEVRDGGIINWSDELPGELTGHPPAPAPRPPLTSRQIKLYRV